jgi:hypothetical protein
MFTQGLAHQRGTIPFQPTRGSVCGLQKSFIENNLNRFHMSILLHSILHIPVIALSLPLAESRSQGRMLRLFPY